jgi:hypothetical protein
MNSFLEENIPSVGKLVNHVLGSIDLTKKTGRVSPAFLTRKKL